MTYRFDTIINIEEDSVTLVPAYRVGDTHKFWFKDGNRRFQFEDRGVRYIGGVYIDTEEPLKSYVYISRYNGDGKRTNPIGYQKYLTKKTIVICRMSK